MQALVYEGPGQKKLAERPEPAIKPPSDAIVKMGKTTICGSDVRILAGGVATCKPGTFLVHVGVGTVDVAGAGITSFRAGDRVSISCISSCGRGSHERQRRRAWQEGRSSPGAPLAAQHDNHDAAGRYDLGSHALKAVQSKRIDTKKLTTDDFKLTEILQAYESFATAADTNAWKGIIAM